MKTNTSLTTSSACGRHPFNLLKGNIHHLILTSSHYLIIFLLSAFSLLLSPLSAQVDENKVSDIDIVKKIEIKIAPKITPEITERAVAPFIDNMSERDYSKYGIKNKSQLEKLNVGKPIPYYIINDGQLTFTDTWSVPLLSDGEPLFFEIGAFSDGLYFFVDIGNANKNIIEHIYNYEYKDSIIGSIGVTTQGRGMDYLIIRKENRDIFVQVYDEDTGEYLINEYSLGEIISLKKERAKKEAQESTQKREKYFEYVADKGELKITPEFEERVFNRFRNASEKFYTTLGIKNKEQLTNLELGKPIPYYWLNNDNLQFAGSWEVPVMSDGVPFHLVTIKLLEDGKYKYVGGGAGWAEALHKYEYKDLIIGWLGAGREMSFLIIRRNGQDVFVKTYDWDTRKALKTEYTLNEIINLIKK